MNEARFLQRPFATHRHLPVPKSLTTKARHSKHLEGPQNTRPLRSRRSRPTHGCNPKEVHRHRDAPSAPQTTHAKAHLWPVHPRQAPTSAPSCLRPVQRGNQAKPFQSVCHPRPRSGGTTVDRGATRTQTNPSGIHFFSDKFSHDPNHNRSSQQNRNDCRLCQYHGEIEGNPDPRHHRLHQPVIPQLRRP